MSENTILHGDCLTLLPTLSANSAAIVLTDPPYLARYRDRSGRTVPNDDNDRWLVPAFAELYRVLANRSFCISFYGCPHADKFMSAYRSAGFRIAGHLLFPKRYASRTGFVRYQHEAAHLLAKGVPPRPAEPISDVIGWRYTGNCAQFADHPTGLRESAAPALAGGDCPGGTAAAAPLSTAAGDRLCGRDVAGPPQGWAVAGRYDRRSAQPGSRPGPSLSALCAWAFRPNRGPRSSSAECCSSCRRIASSLPRGFPGAGDSGEAVPSCSWWGSDVGIGTESVPQWEGRPVWSALGPVAGFLARTTRVVVSTHVITLPYRGVSTANRPVLLPLTPPRRPHPPAPGGSACGPA
jgi:hypothetical protein